MNYSIIFTIYGLVFAIMLLITFLIKKNKITIRKKLYWGEDMRNSKH